jgi:hypothetical protein
VRSADATVLCISMVTVIGPTPPGTGVISDAFSAAKIHVAHELSVCQSVDSNINDHRAGPDHLRHDQIRLARSHHQDIGKDCELSQIARFSVTDADRRVALHQHQRHGLADNIAGADNHHVLAFQGNVFVLQQLENPIGRARRKYRVAYNQSADIVEMKSVNVLVR